MKAPLNILHVEDSAVDSELVKEMLKEDGLDCTIERIETRDELLRSLEKSEYDLILSDCTLPQFHGLEALEVVHALKPEVPFIFVSGTIGEEIAINSLHNGATDYVLKHHISRLVPAVRRALSEVNERAMRRSMEEKLSQARRMEAIGTMAGGLVHDFNNLLQVIKMNASLLQLELENPAQILKISDTLVRTSDRGASLMRELSAFARATDTHITAVDMARVMGEIAGTLQTFLPDKLELVLQVDEDIPRILADEDQLHRMVTNLVINARDAMPEGGKIIISVEVVEFGPGTVSPSQENTRYLCLKIADTGTGMDEAAQKRAFEPYFTTKPVGKGTGLGLAVVYGLMQAHHGLIGLQSKPRVGTTISLFFPVSASAEVKPEMIKKVPPLQILGACGR